MKAVVCLDDRGGMMFNRRRQSRDRLLIEDVVSSLNGSTLRLCPYSASLFAEQNVSPIVSEEFLAEAGQGDVCFVEDRALLPYGDRIEEMILYRWNRRYPYDMKLDMEPLSNGFSLQNTTEFAGFSHEKITKEIYKK